jgi:molybdopterin synthase sulfur carrier subunit
LRQKFPESSEKVHVSEGMKLHDLFVRLVERYGERFQAHVFDPVGTEVNRDILVNINDKPIRQMQGLGTKLSDGDQIDILPLFAGGG